MKKCKKYDIECAYNCFTILGYRCIANVKYCTHGPVICHSYSIPCPHAVKNPCGFEGTTCDYLRHKYNDRCHEAKKDIVEVKPKIENSFFGMDV